MDYLRAVLNNDKKSEKQHLNNLVKIGKKLNKDVSTYEKELTKLASIKTSTKKVVRKKTTTKNVTSKKKTTTYKNSAYNISKVTVEENQIIIDFKHYIKKDYIHYSEEKRGGKYYDIFDFDGRFEDASPTKLVMNGVDRIRITQYKYRTLRIELINDYNLKAIYIISKKRVIIKILNLKNTTKNTSKSIADKIRQNKDKVVVIDPGHGGKDSGAIGDRKRYEKNTVLTVAKHLYYDLKKRGYTVYLTRNKDKFIELRDRTKFANRKNADIFISIHANAVPKSQWEKAKGIETFFLSPARSSRAKRIAAIENKTDMSTMNNSSQNALLTILNQSKITSSQKLGIDVQQNLLYTARKKYKDIEDGGVREGPFWVLVGAQMPSILIEIGYITNSTEGRRLFETSYQKLLAKGIANGVDSYFAKNQ
ncbi:N-acetylmuramoyl-L-alanine amidase [Arcobacter nitrofigilis DSM 7299]|uniref:N-acetylmuramoyl-L-alanine amidase n=1 Tax=Arcobacter nitrofigilis (strain ATCC 33309 / DSM 7299 / CCUG 15893 / LMG 7604 / NCTC 12251 / CI) TaxID=572480 RepID=D5V2Z7_ARCNC|nr:N-acetylmuramoyl-L-alanine amidase [Arcobacter nitrofigilis]ADG92579.1 N-acetylmuramoyl-L-alanine amidase [Arcobacter nitrofigilis DSM 7299]